MTVKVEVNSVSKYLGGDLEFNLPQQPELFDEVANDYIGSVSFDDIEKEIQVFTDSGWSEDEIREMYKEACPPMDGESMRKDTVLKRPVTVTLTIRQWRLGLEAKAMQS